MTFWQPRKVQEKALPKLDTIKDDVITGVPACAEYPQLLGDAKSVMGLDLQRPSVQRHRRAGPGPYAMLGTLRCSTVERLDHPAGRLTNLCPRQRLSLKFRPEHTGLRIIAVRFSYALPVCPPLLWLASTRTGLTSHLTCQPSAKPPTNTFLVLNYEFWAALPPTNIDAKFKHGWRNNLSPFGAATAPPPPRYPFMPFSNFPT